MNTASQASSRNTSDPRTSPDTHRILEPSALWRRAARYAFPLLGGVGFAYVLYLVFRSPTLGHDLLGLGIGTILLLAGTQLLNDFLVPVQWRTLHAPLGHIGLGISARVILPNLYVNYFPLRGAIILVRMYVARGEGVPMALSASSLFLLFTWRWIVVLALMPLLPLVIPGLGLKIAVLALAFLAALIAGFLFRRKFLSVTTLLGYWMKRSPKLRELNTSITGMEEQIEAMLHSRGILIHTGIFLGVSMLTAMALSLVFQSVGVSVSPLPILLAWYASLLMGWLSHLPGGIGAQEASFAYLVSLAGVPIETAMAVAVLWRLVAAVVDLTVSGGSFLVFRFRASPAAKADNKNIPSCERVEEGVYR